MITHYEYAVLSDQAYTNATIGLPNLGYNFPPGWELLNTSGISNNINGFFALAVKKANEVVIAFRGTDQTKPWAYFSGDLNDDVSIFMGTLPPQISDAIIFTQNIKSLITADDRLAFTGHSLGAALAEMMAAQEGKLAITFDSPGSHEILVKQNIKPAMGFSVINYQAAPHFINTINSHPYEVLRLYPSRSIYNSVDIDGYLDFTLGEEDVFRGEHSLDGLLEQFNPVTGRPYQYTNMTDQWPLGTLANTFCFDRYKSYADNPYYWQQYMKQQGFSSVGQQVFIQGSLGGYGNSAETGITILADDSGNNIWGATTKADVIIAGIGSDIHRGFLGNDLFSDRGGNDAYYIFENEGHDIISDLDNKGTLFFNNAPLNGTAQFTTTPGVWLKKQGQRLFVMSKTQNRILNAASGLDLTITADQAVDQTIHSITVSNFDNGALGIDLAMPSNNECDPQMLECTLTGGSAADTLDTTMYANVATTFIRGEGGDDYLIGNARSDVMSGGEGNDFILCDKGSTNFIGRSCSARGGLGTDIFKINPISPFAEFDLKNLLTISDFQPSFNEKIDLQSYSTIKSINDLKITSATGGSIITLPNGDIIKLIGISLNQLRNNHFIFYEDFVKRLKPTPPIVGTNQDDELIITEDGTEVYGFDGNDSLRFSSHQNVLNGGKGSDVFTIVKNENDISQDLEDNFPDFEIGEDFDILELEGFDYASVKEIAYSPYQTNGTSIFLSDRTLVLPNVPSTQFDPERFMRLTTTTTDDSSRASAGLIAGIVLPLLGIGFLGAIAYRHRHQIAAYPYREKTIHALTEIKNYPYIEKAKEVCEDIKDYPYKERFQETAQQVKNYPYKEKTLSLWHGLQQKASSLVNRLNEISRQSPEHPVLSSQERP